MKMGEALQRVRQIMGEPAYIPASVPWDLAPAEFGCQLPSDYRAFVDLYGSVSFAGEWGVDTPMRSPLVPGSPGGLAGWRFENDVEFRAQVELEDAFLERERTPVFPDPGGLLAWGGTSNFGRCCWLTNDPDPDRWPVVVWFRGELDHFDGGFADFVATVLSGDYAMEAELLAYGDPEGEPAPPQALWRPGCDWAGTDWQARWPLPPGSTDTPWANPAG